MLLNNLDTYDKFVTYILGMLGEPLIKVNISEEQILNRISDAIQLFAEWHCDGHSEAIIIIQLERDKTVYDLKNNSSGKIALTVLNELRTASLTDWFMSNALHKRENPIILYQNWGDFDRYFATTQFIDFIRDTFKSRNTFNFNFTTQKLTLINNPVNQDSTDTRLRAFKAHLIDAYNVNDEGGFEVNNSVYNNEWLKKYCVASVKEQWGQNLIKFGNTPLPGGMQLNGNEIRNEAVRDLENLTKRLKEEFQAPIPILFQ